MGGATAGTARRPGAGAALWLSRLLIIVPVLALIGGAFFVGGFVPASNLWIWCGAAALVHAALFYWARDDAGRRPADTSGASSRRVALSRPLLLVSALLFVGAWVLDDVFIAAELAWACGTPVDRVAHVTGKWHNRGKGCPYHVYLSAPDGPSAFSRCIDESSWRAQRIGDPVQLRVLTSPLGLFVSSEDAFLP